jgi:APA family basic amino acid/polyamine antiporter
MGEQKSEKLVRAVGLWGLVAMCINAVIGSGVFLLPSESYRLLGAFSLWAPLIFALPVFILALCFAEAASYFSEPGGAYLYARTAFGDFIGFETGWMNWLARVTSLASLSNGFVVSLARLYPPLGQGAWRGALIIGSLLILGIIHFIGVKYGAVSIYVFTFGKVVPLVGFIIIALILFRHNPVPESLHLPGRGTDWGGAALFMLFAYAGFENLGVPAGEYKDPRRDLPKALLIGLLIIGAIYVLAQLGAMSALTNLGDSKTPIADAAAALVGTWGAVVITLGAVLSMAGTNSGTVLEGSRMLYALSLDRRMGPVSYVHPRFRTPSVAIVVHVIVATVLALISTFANMALFSAGARLTTYLFTCAALPRLRKLSEGGFRTPGLWMPILGTLTSIALVVSLDRQKLIAGVIALAIGVAIWAATRR